VLYERHLVFDNVIDRSADTRTQFEVFARSVRDISEYANRYMEGEPEFSGLTIREIHGAEEPDASERSTLDKNKLSQAASQSRERLHEHV
jgi:hypothetical protein